jgi:hypothetical protein
LPIEEINVNGVWDYRIWLHDPQHLLLKGAAAAAESEYKMTLLNDVAHVYQDVPLLCLTVEGKVVACRVISVNAFDSTQFDDCVGPFRYADFSRYLDKETCKQVQHMVGLYRSRQRGPT